MIRLILINPLKLKWKDSDFTSSPLFHFRSSVLHRANTTTLCHCLNTYRLSKYVQLPVCTAHTEERAVLSPLSTPFWASVLSLRVKDLSAPLALSLMIRGVTRGHL